MRIDWWTLVLQTVNVLILVGILARFLFRPVIAIMDGAASGGGEDARRRRGGEGQGRRRARGRRGRARQIAAARDAVLREAAGQANAQREAALAAAKEDADQVAGGGRNRNALGARFGRGRRLRPLGKTRGRRRPQAVARLPDAAQVDGFIDGLASALASLPRQAATVFGARDTPRLTAPRALTAAEMQVAATPSPARSAGRSTSPSPSTRRHRRPRTRDAARGRAQQLSRRPQTHRRGVDGP